MHELEFGSSGVARMISVKKSPWHHLGKILQNPPTTKEAIEQAQMNHTIHARRLRFDSMTLPDGKVIDGNLTDCYSLVRDDGVILTGTDTVTKQYKILQPHEAFSFFDPFLAAGEATIETAGFLRGGTIMWVLAKLNRDPMVIVPGDEVEKYILLSNSYDGKTSIRTGFTPVRVECANKLAMACADSASSLLKVKHKSGMHDALDGVREIMNLANAKFEATADQYRFLASKQISAKDLDKYVDIVFPRKSEKDKDIDASEPDSGSNVSIDVLATDNIPAADASDWENWGVGEAPAPAPRAPARPNANQKESRGDKFDRERADIIKSLFVSGKGNALKGVRGTHWAAYNAVTEYLTHKRPRMTAEARIDSLTFGSSGQGSDAISHVALGAALQFAEATA